MNDLNRELAPICGKAWAAIEEEARHALRLNFAARKLVDFVGPGGWELAAVTTGRVEPVENVPGVGARMGLRQVQPLVELRIPFDLAREEIDAIARGCDAPRLDAVTGAAQLMAHAEDSAVFRGLPDAGVRGICSHTTHKEVSLSADYLQYPGAVTSATESLRQSGVGGPYGIALGPRCYAGLAETAGPGGFPVLQHVKQLLDGPVVWAPAVDGAVVMSLRGGDFCLMVGRDVSIGYLDHTDTQVSLYLEESFTFRLTGPEAAVPLAYAE